MPSIENFDISVIYTRPDGSYVIDNGLYHVPNEGAWTDLYEQVHRYAQAHPEVVQLDPSLQESAEKQLLEIINGSQGILDTTDWYVVRSAETGTAIPEEIIQARAQARIDISDAREQLASITGSGSV